MILSNKLSFSEEVGNSVSHGVMAILLLFAMPFITLYTFVNGDYFKAISVSICIICLFLMFLISTLYHSMAYETKHKLVFRILDHSCIFIAIAGTYTPVALTKIGGITGILVVIFQWIVVILGILYKILGKSNSKLSLALYIAMGWIGIIFTPKIIRNSSITFMLLILLGGIMYSVGAYFYSKKNLKFHHMIWHLFINVASLFHIAAVVFAM